MEAKIYNQEGKMEGTIDLPKAVFNAPWNPDLVHQVTVGMAANARSGRAHTKNRGEVSGGGKKPWRQKGTGRARHGSTRSPLWRKGGVTHGPRNDRIYAQKINKKMKTKALRTILSAKLRDGEILFLKDLKLSAAKTRAAQTILKTLSGLSGFERLNYAGRRTIVALPARDEAIARSFRNLPSAVVAETRNLNPLELLRRKHLIIVDPAKSLPMLSR